MIKNLLTNEIYQNRKEAKEKLGHSTYNKMVKNRQISWHSKTYYEEEKGVVYYEES